MRAGRGVGTDRTGAGLVVAHDVQALVGGPVRRAGPGGGVPPDADGEGEAEAGALEASAPAFVPSLGAAVARAPALVQPASASRARASCVSWLPRAPLLSA